MVSREIKVVPPTWSRPYTTVYSITKEGDATDARIITTFSKTTPIERINDFVEGAKNAKDLHGYRVSWSIRANSADSVSSRERADKNFGRIQIGGVGGHHSNPFLCGAGC